MIFDCAAIGSSSYFFDASSSFFDASRRKKYVAGVQIVDFEAQEILLGLKLRGFGSGKWQHTFAGKRERGETAAETAARELHEETGLGADVERLELVAQCEYEFVDPHVIGDLILHVDIFRPAAAAADDDGLGNVGVVGSPTDSDEIKPVWFSASAAADASTDGRLTTAAAAAGQRQTSGLPALPLAEMWADNRLWLPHLLKDPRRKVKVYCLYENLDEIRSHRIEFVDGCF